MIAFNDCDGTTDLDKAFKNSQGAIRVREMLQNMTHKNMVEKRRLKFQIENVGLLELDVVKTFRFYCSLGFGNRICGYVDGNERCLRAVACKRNCLSAYATTGFQNPAAGLIRCVEM